jgi:hypothetical protein
MKLAQSNIAVETEVSLDDIMETFRIHFRLVAGCHVSDDGREMRYQLKNEKTADIWLANAIITIMVNKLSLEAKVDVWKSGRLVHNVALVITYKP